MLSKLDLALACMILYIIVLMLALFNEKYKINQTITKQRKLFHRKNKLHGWEMSEDKYKDQR